MASRLPAVRPRVELSLLGRSWSSFRACGYIGLVAAASAAQVAIARQGLSPWLMAGITLAAVAGFHALAIVTRLVTGRDMLIYYHHAALVAAITVVACRLAGEPVLAYLDVTTLAVGLFLACGRVGCLLVGCCHGVPARLGIRYSGEHAAAGFPRELVGVPLVPVQAYESLLVLGIVAAGLVLLGRVAAGTVTAIYLAAYASCRWVLELARGDRDRGYLWSFSHAQWTSLVVAGGVATAGTLGLLPAGRWQAGVATMLAAATLALGVWRQGRSPLRRCLFHPGRRREIAAAVARVKDSGPQLTPEIVETSCGLRLSSQLVGDRDAAKLQVFTLSSRAGLPPADCERALARSLQLLTAPQGATFSIRRDHVLHVLIRCPLMKPEVP